ncbi:MAG: hypothetical protein K9I29_03990 [Bacteroidales bacterium]|nr:hypothetical protein [Bacteroidales bacterium]MCF8327434.1 hypothetical protein [Bacteroidales bacterium]
MTKLIFSIPGYVRTYCSCSHFLTFYPGNDFQNFPVLQHPMLSELMRWNYWGSFRFEKIKKHSIKLSFLFVFLLLNTFGLAQLKPGNVAVVGVNIEDDSMNNDQISMVTFDTITTGMTIEITDNGWQQTYPDRWGNQEGVISLTRTGPDINPGFVFTIKGTGSQPSDFSMSPDGNNWSVDMVVGTFDLTLNDQFWVLQGGHWSNNSDSTDKATYDGNIITGWSAPEWNNNYANPLINSDVYPNMNCLVFSFDVNVKHQKLKYKNGSFQNASKREWINRITDYNNWKDFNSTSSYENSNPDYIQGYMLDVSTDSITDGIWYGDKNHNWFDCANWSDLTVPGEESDVYMNSHAQRYLEIDSDAEYSGLFNDTAKCRNLTVNEDSILLFNNSDQLDISGNLLINGGKLIANSGHISVRGNWQSVDTLGFFRGDGVVKFYGNSQQTIANDQAREYFNQLEVEKPQGTKLELRANVNTRNLNLISGHVLLDTFNLIVDDSLEGGDQQNYIITKNDHASGGYLFLEPNDTETLFPVGTENNYTPVSISNSGTEVFKVRTFDGIFENGYSGSALTGDIVNRTWAIELVNADSAVANIKLQWNKSLEENEFSIDRDKGVMIFNSGKGMGNDWADWSLLLSKSQPPAGTNPFTIQSLDVNHFGLFGVHNRCQHIEINTSKIYHY